jgi:hypothetical protein
MAKGAVRRSEKPKILGIPIWVMPIKTEQKARVRMAYLVSTLPLK